VVLHHHERLDGRGYPAGLRGTEIPLAARIVAVSDAFDAITSDRPYRRGQPADVALQVLRDGRGRQWDPEVVEAFIEVFAGDAYAGDAYAADDAGAAGAGAAGGVGGIGLGSGTGRRNSAPSA
jgi:HD-GYP domain-containing protein (c-di-GMP phosphodiesterase class II)